MKIIEVLQGSPEWLAHRAKSFNASDAPAMLGISPYTTRNELLRIKSGGIIPEVDSITQKRFDKGHEIEDFAHPLAEREVDDDLYPVTATDDDGWLSASFDGITINNDVIWECKTANETLRAALDGGDLPDGWWPQVEQQILISGALFCLFTISDGTEAGTRHMKYSSKPERRARLIAGWKQFQADLAHYKPVEVIPSVVSTPQMQLPSVSIQVNGGVTVIDNLSAFGDALCAYVERINKTPATDQDFADLEATVKTLKTAEDALESAKANALGQVASIDQMKRMADQLQELARVNRLTVEKIVKAEKDNRRSAIVRSGQDALRAYINECNKAIGKPYMPEIPADFAGSVKGLKTIASIQNAVDTTLAQAKAIANLTKMNIELNLITIRREPDYAFLFHDEAQLAIKQDREAVEVIVSGRISEQQAAAKKRLEDEFEKIRKEEEAKAIAKIEAGQTQWDQEPCCQKPAVAAPVVAQADDGQMIKLGDISNRLGFVITTAFLAGLGFQAKWQKKMRLYRECDFPDICSALIRHINIVAKSDHRKAA